MSANDNVIVRIVGDASGVQPAVEQTEVSLGALGPIVAELTASVKALTAQMSEGFMAGAASAKKLAIGMEEAKVASTGLGTSIGSMSERLRFGGLSVGIFEKALAPLVGIIAAAFAVDKIAGFINKMAEASEKVVHLSQQFGMSVAEVQKLQGVATATGISIDALTRGMAFLDKNMATAASGSKRMQSTMDQLGVSFNDGRTQMEKLAVIADKFKNMDDGPKKVALAMQAFSKSGREMIPVLNLGSDGIQKLNEKMTEYGVVNDDAIAKGAALAESTNETKLGFAGVENVLTGAFAPALKGIVDGLNSMIQAFVQSYQQGGTVAVIFGIISAAIEIVVSVVEALGSIFEEIWGVITDVIGDIAKDIMDAFGVKTPKYVNYAKVALNEFKDVLTLVKDAVEIALDVISAAFRGTMQVVMTFATVAWDALHLKWGDIASDWRAGMAKVDQIVAQEATNIRQHAAEMAAAIQAAAHGDAIAGASTGLALPKAGGDFDFKPSGGNKKSKKPKDDLVQQLDQELEAKKAAWEQEQLAQDTAQQFSLQSEADFWDQALKRTDLSAKDRFEITKKWIAAEKALQSDRIAAVLDGDKREIFEADKNAQAKLAILQKEAAFIRKTYGDQSKETRAADDAALQAQRTATEQQIQLIGAVAKARADAAMAQVDEAQKSAELQEQLGLITKGRLLQQERQFEQQRYQIDLAALIQRRGLIDPARDPVGYQAINLQIEALERQHQQKLTQIDRQAVLERTAIERQGIQNLSSSWATTLSKMLTLQESFSQGVRDLYMGMVQTAATAIEQIIEKWLILHLTKLLMGKQETAQDAANYVAQAGAGGVASMAAAPFPINLTAPAFGASMAAAAAAFGVVGSAEAGAVDVSEGLYHLHEKEMVLPAWAANPLRTMLQDGGGAAANVNSRGGDVHLHSSPTFNGNIASWQDMVDKHERDMMRWLDRKVRNGAFNKALKAA